MRVGVPDHRRDISEFINAYNSSAYNADSRSYHVRERLYDTKNVLHERTQQPFVTKLRELVLLLFDQVENIVNGAEVGRESDFGVFLILLYGGPPDVFLLRIGRLDSFGYRHVGSEMGVGQERGDNAP